MTKNLPFGAKVHNILLCTPKDSVSPIKMSILPLRKNSRKGYLGCYAPKSRSIIFLISEFEIIKDNYSSLLGHKKFYNIQTKLKISNFLNMFYYY
jgi:hypothetical protein